MAKQFRICIRQCFGPLLGIRMNEYLIKNIAIVNEGRTNVGDVLIAGGRIRKIGGIVDAGPSTQEIDGTGLHLLPGAIDDQVHFREPGLTHKATIYTEAKAAVAGGVTSFMEMPNTVPNALTQELLEEKYATAANTSLANFSFYMGVSNSNADEVLKTNQKRNDVCGIKIFMGSSTGNMLVDNYLTLDKIFRESQVLIATHCEAEDIIRQNREKLVGVELQPYHHPIIRDELACLESSFTAVQLAKKHNTRLHILHITTADELRLFTNFFPLREKRITAEVCVHHLHFTADDYATLGYAIKCNPAIKASKHKEALWEALLDDRLDVIATDHAPHLWTEKQPPYDHAHSGLPLVQHSLLLMLHYVRQGKITLEKMVEKMSHAVADCFQIKERGYIREGYWADLVMVNLNQTHTANKENLLYKCGWSPLEHFSFPASVEKTFVSGHLVYNGGHFNENVKGMRLQFDR
jgi:dihydroorotase